MFCQCNHSLVGAPCKVYQWYAFNNKGIKNGVQLPAMSSSQEIPGVAVTLNGVKVSDIDVQNLLAQHTQKPDNNNIGTSIISPMSVSTPAGSN